MAMPSSVFAPAASACLSRGVSTGLYTVSITRAPFSGESSGRGDNSAVSVPAIPSGVQLM